MTYARRAVRTHPPLSLPRMRAAIVALAVLATVVVGALGPLGLRIPAPDVIRIDPAVIEAGRDWEIMRREQSGWVDPVIVAGREWERQRKQQMGYEL
ncbi:MAG TPA: hypothetical protein VHR55_03515 [Candidatus Limnocylindria bacterium]|nr:hypothetical protein [Candidatus Limnocylindria bacterium]